MPKSKVETLLGGPGDCILQVDRVPGSQCRYGSDLKKHGVEVALEVEYHYFSTDADDAVYTGLLEEYSLGAFPE
jgi:hypothetical protein